MWKKFDAAGSYRRGFSGVRGEAPRSFPIFASGIYHPLISGSSKGLLGLYDHFHGSLDKASHSRILYSTNSFILHEVALIVLYL